MKPLIKITSLAVVFVIFLFGCKKECGEGLKGSDCNDEVRAQYYGSYTVATSCSTSYTATISSSTKGALYVSIGNIDKLGSTVYAKFDESNPNTLVIPAQEASGVAGNYFQGSVTYTTAFSAASITYTKTLTGGIILPACTGTIVEQ